jgi:glycosyltransferase involved in cell wall biosynthesis
VSVIIPFFNAERFLEEAIESVFGQTYAEWELVLADDGSTDGSPAIAQRYAQRYPGRVRYVAHPGHRNRRISATRNLGLDHAEGAYVAFLDADDVWLPHKLAEQVALLESHPEAAMVYGPALVWYSWTAAPEDRGRDFVQALGVELDALVRPPAVIVQFLHNDAITPLASNMLLRRSVFDRVGRFEARFRGFYEDQVFLTKLCLELPVLAASTCWHKYRQHPDSYCAVWGKTAREQAERLAFLEWAEGYLLTRRANHGELWKALQAALRRYRHPRRHRLLTGAQYVESRARQVLGSAARRLLPAPLYEGLRGVMRAWNGR